MSPSPDREPSTSTTWSLSIIYLHHLVPVSLEDVDLLCMECGTKATEFSSHYPSFVSCLLCPYTTFCSCAYASHMIICFELECMQCDFVSLTGDKMAEHLVLNPGHDIACRPRTALKEPDIEFSLQGGTQQKPSPPDTTITPDPVNPSWTRVAGSDLDTLKYIRVGRFKQDKGPRHALPKSADAMEYFLLAYPESLLELIAKETNAHVKTCQYLGMPSPQWTLLSVPELKAFLGLVILMGVHGLPDISQYWSLTQHDRHTFDQAMSLRRFKQIATNIRMGSLVTDEYRGGGNPKDGLHILRPMLDILGQAMWKAYRPNCNLTIDRTLLPALEDQAGHRMLTYRQTLPEIWLLCDSKSGYCHRLSIHTRESGEHETVGLQVVPRLMEGLEGMNHRLYLANSLASPRLMRQLLKQGIYASSSFPILSPVLPMQLWQEGNLTIAGHYLQWQSGPLLATRWRDAKEMGCLCTNSFPGRVDTVWRRSQTQAGKLDPLERPMAFRLLQENMRGVDICKQLLACNPLGGVPQDCHWRSLFWFLLNLSVVNSFIVLRESRKSNPPAWVQSGLFSQLNFRRRLGTQLAQCYHRPPETQDPASGGEGERETVAGETVARETLDPLKEMHRMTKISLCTKRCWNCNLKHIRHETAYGCPVCKANLCNKASCFWEFHGLCPLTKGK
ncbi:PiggyBac transposable element-derived protein 4 [Merluccius polli]|uniref:PiggyBac transposable element-derived protein 4 n=1 Tax=Merluccius polli TaxID=89951 RepID=A0AA47M095_MERPO|nr:PiggyBac transposable element-derived protein 4 [Merluccius polli]